MHLQKNSFSWVISIFLMSNEAHRHIPSFAMDSTSANWLNVSNALALVDKFWFQRSRTEMIRLAQQHEVLCSSKESGSTKQETQPIVYCQSVESVFSAYTASSDDTLETACCSSYVLLGRKGSGKTSAVAALTNRASPCMPKRTLTFKLSPNGTPDGYFRELLTQARVPLRMKDKLSPEEMANLILKPLVDEPALNQRQNYFAKGAQKASAGFSRLLDAQEFLCTRGRGDVKIRVKSQPITTRSIEYTQPPGKKTPSDLTDASTESEEDYGMVYEAPELLGDKHHQQDYHGDHRPVLVIDGLSSPMSNDMLNFAEALVKKAHQMKVVVFYLTTSKHLACQLVAIDPGGKIQPLPSLMCEKGSWLDGLDYEQKGVILKRMREKCMYDMGDFGWKQFDLEVDAKQTVLTNIFANDLRVSAFMISRVVTQGGPIGDMVLKVYRAAAVSRGEI